MLKFISKPPYLGTAYYPEAFPISEIETDITLMKQAGIKLVRIGEFAWSTIEKKEGEYDFSLFQKVIKRLYDEGIAVIFCTPTAAPPAWLTEKYPDMLITNSKRQTLQHGGQRHICSNNPYYIEYSIKIIEKIAEELSNHPNIIAWQLDSAVYPNGESSCFCPICRRKFIEYIKELFNNDINEYNLTYNLAQYSQSYNSFSQIPAPRENVRHNPHLKLDWSLFQQKSQLDFMNIQTQVLQKYTSKPISTSTLPLMNIDHVKINKNMNIAMLDSSEEQSLSDFIFNFDLFRNIKIHPFWNSEVANPHKKYTATQSSIRPDGFYRASSWLQIAMGAEANLYRPWRTPYAGQELEQTAIISSNARPNYIFDEIAKTSKEFDKAADFINNTRLKSSVAVHYSSGNAAMLDMQKKSEHKSFMSTLIDIFYQPLCGFGIRPDVVSNPDLTNYKLLFSPMCMSLEEYSMNKKIEKWVYDGGIWVAGPLTDLRNSKGVKYFSSPFGIIEKLTGAFLKYQINDENGLVKAKWNDGTEFRGQFYYDIFDSDENDLVKIYDGYSALKGKSVVKLLNYGKGKIILLGTFPSRIDMEKIIGIACKLSGTEAFEIKGSVMAAYREGSDDIGKEYKGIAVCEYGGKQGSININKAMLDLLTGKMFIGNIKLEPFDVLMLKEPE